MPRPYSLEKMHQELLILRVCPHLSAVHFQVVLGASSPLVFCWISSAITFWYTFSLYKYVQGKSGLPESAPDHQVFKIKTDESEYQTQGTSPRQG